jgi:hypothetical protein
VRLAGLFLPVFLPAAIGLPLGLGGRADPRGHLRRVSQLTLLAPGLVEAMLDGRQPADMTLPRLLAPFPAGWAEHRAIPGASARPEPAAAG